MEFEIGIRLTVILFVAIVFGSLLLAGSKRPPGPPSA